MHLGRTKKIHNPIPPEYANVSLLKMITVCVGLVCLIITSYTTWTIYILSGHISNYQTVLANTPAIPRKITPIDFELFEKTMAIDKEKQSFTLTPIVWDMFYSRTVTSTETTTMESTTSTATTTSRL